MGLMDDKMTRYQELKSRNDAGTLADADRDEFMRLRTQFEE